MRILLLAITPLSHENPLLAVALAFAAGASAQPRDRARTNWPSRAIHLIVPFPPQLARPDRRVLSEKLASACSPAGDRRESPRPGGNLGTALVARAAPDGYTIGISIPGPLAVKHRALPENGIRPVQGPRACEPLGASPNMLVVDPGLKVIR